MDKIDRCLSQKSINKMEYDIFTTSDNTKRYYKKGTNILHRENGPAVEFWNGDQIWYIDGKKHRLSGPAVVYICGLCFEWWINGNRHREDGPAVEWCNGGKEWWIYGKRISPEKETILNKWWENKNGI